MMLRHSQFPLTVQFMDGRMDRWTVGPLPHPRQLILSISVRCCSVESYRTQLDCVTVNMLRRV